jgi:hypothetical protein
LDVNGVRQAERNRPAAFERPIVLREENPHVQLGATHSAHRAAELSKNSHHQPRTVARADAIKHPHQGPSEVIGELEAYEEASTRTARL